MDGRVNVQANAFFADYHDFQRSVTVGFGPTGMSIFEIENADRAISYCLELGVDALILDELRIFANLGLLRTEIREFDIAANPGVEGSEFPRAPNVTFSFGADYEPIDNLTLGTRVRFVDSYFKGADEDPATKNDAYVVADFSLSYTFRNVEAFAYVDNAFNNIYTTNGGGFGFHVIGQPREFGVGLRIDF